MKLTEYFIKHPVIAIVLNTMIGIVGLLALYQLPLREYPNISMPTFTVLAFYPNASAELVESAVTNVLEEKLAGLENLETITSESQAGNVQITLKFYPATSVDKAFSSVQDAVASARAELPNEVKSPQIQKQSKSSGVPFIAISLEYEHPMSRGLSAGSSLDPANKSKDVGVGDFGALTHMAQVNLKNTFRTIPGVGSVEVWGQPYTYKITLSPEKLFSFGVNVDEVTNALTRSHISLPAGKYQNKIPSHLYSAPKTVSDYEEILIKPHPRHPIFLKSVADVKLTTDNEQFRIRVNGHPGVILAINRSADANPLEVSRDVNTALNNLSTSLPQGMKAKIVIDQADFIKASIKNIRHSIAEAILLVLFIVFIMLRNIRATLIPLITIPISLLGSLLFLKLFGYSLNLMTLLAMVLAIGLVVDDAIVVLENIWRHIEEGMSGLEAAIKGAREIGFAIVAMTLTLVSVYLPIAFMPGMIGQFFIEFAIALAGSVLISGVVALTLSPMMCARLLRSSVHSEIPHYVRDDVDDTSTSSRRTCNEGSPGVNMSSYYARILAKILPYQKTLMLLAALSLLFSMLFYQHITSETAPKEDRGLIGIYIPSLAGEDINVLDKKLGKIEQDIFGTVPYQSRLTFIGDWGASLALPLKPHAHRRESAEHMVTKLNGLMNHYPSIDPFVWNWDTALPGLDNAGSGSDLALVIATPESYKELFTHLESLKQTIEASKEFESVNFDLHLDTLGYKIELDNNQLAKLGLNAEQVAKTIAVFFSGDKSQTFEKDGVVYNITLLGSKSPWTLDELYLTTPTGKRVSLGAVTKMVYETAPANLKHQQHMRAATLNVKPLTGESTTEASEKLMQIVKANVPTNYRLTWTGSVKAAEESAHTMSFLLLLSLIFIYAVLAIQFENFIDPLIILFTAPLACFGALFSAWMFGQTLNIFTQVGLITLIGLVSKHGILMVEFANQLRSQGKNALEAICEAAKLRLRPIIMTTGAMIFGAIPLILSHDAGSEARRAIGIVLVGGLSLGTLFTLFILPFLYALVYRIRATTVRKSSIERTH